MANKGTFNQGWWNCFESFAAELLSVSNDETVCRRVLDAAGITVREALAWLNKGNHDPKVEAVVRIYLLKA